MTKIGITVITDIDDLVKKVKEFADNLTAQDLGYRNHRVIELPHVNNALEDWKIKNYTMLSPYEMDQYTHIKNRIENLMVEFQQTV